MHLEHFPTLGQKSGVLPEGCYRQQDSKINIFYFPLKASAGDCVSECWTELKAGCPVHGCVHAHIEEHPNTDCSMLLSKPLLQSPIVANSKCLPQNTLPASSSLWFRDSLSQRLCLWAFALDSPHQTSLPHACLYSLCCQTPLLT